SAITSILTQTSYTTNAGARADLAFSTLNGGGLTEAARFTSFGNFGIGTTTPFWALTVSSSTGPQLALADDSAGSNAWTLRSINNSFFLATSTALATSTTAAFAINQNGAATFGNNLTVNA